MRSGCSLYILSCRVLAAPFERVLHTCVHILYATYVMLTFVHYSATWRKRKLLASSAAIFLTRLANKQFGEK